MYRFCSWFACRTCKLTFHSRSQVAVWCLEIIHVQVPRFCRDLNATRRPRSVAAVTIPLNKPTLKAQSKLTDLLVTIIPRRRACRGLPCAMVAQCHSIPSWILFCQRAAWRLTRPPVRMKISGLCDELTTTGKTWLIPTPLPRAMNARAD